MINSSGTLLHFYSLQVIATLKGHTKKVTNVVYHPHEVFSLSSVTFLSRSGSLFGWNIFPGSFCYIILFDLKPLNHRQMLHDHTFNYLNLTMFFFPLVNFLLLTTCMTVHVNMVLKEQNFELFWQGVHINVLNHKILRLIFVMISNRILDSQHQQMLPFVYGLFLKQAALMLLRWE